MVEIPVFIFDTTVFTKNDPDKEWKLRDSRQIASFLFAQRFGEKTKMGFLCLNKVLKIAENFHLPYDGMISCLSEHSPADKYGKDKFEAVDIIYISDGRSMIRAKKNGEYLSAEMLCKADMENLAKGTLTKEEAAELYLKNTEIAKMDRAE